MLFKKFLFSSYKLWCCVVLQKYSHVTRNCYLHLGKWDNKFLWNVSTLLPDYMGSYYRRQNLHSHHCRNLQSNKSIRTCWDDSLVTWFNYTITVVWLLSSTWGFWCLRPIILFVVKTIPLFHGCLVIVI